MAEVPGDLKYTREHEWVRVEDGGLARVGITDFAQEHLGDVVYLDLPEVGATVRQFEKMGEIESVKTVSELIAPVSGEVVAVNPKLKDTPTLVNEDPYGEGWLIHTRLSAPAEVDGLLTAAEYAAHV